jgi:soluble lytic murein transglycosylase
MEVRADGVKVIRNEAPAARERRFSSRLVAAPTTRIAELIDRYAAEHDLDPRLVQAVMQAESGYDASALSTKGAIGLMQLMPETARELAVVDPWDPEQNVRGGVAYLKRMVEMFSNELDFALAAYNAGPNAVLRYAGVPPYAETRDYVRKVRCIYDGDCGEGELSVAGRKVHVVRDGNGGIILTTSGPGG